MVRCEAMNYLAMADLMARLTGKRTVFGLVRWPIEHGPAAKGQTSQRLIPADRARGGRSYVRKTCVCDASGSEPYSVPCS